MVTETKTTHTTTCEDCKIACQRFGTHRNEEKALLIIQLLLEGNSIRSTERITNVDRNTIMKVLVLAGEKCEKLMGRLIVNVPVKDVQCDEIWGFVQKKEAHKRPAEENDESMGDAYCFVASSAIPSSC